MIAADASQDVNPSGYSQLDIPIHQVGIVAMGLWLIDAAQFDDLLPHCKRLHRWTFMFVLAPLHFPGVTGSTNGFQLEDSMIRSAEALERLCLVLAITMLYLVSLGTSVVQRGKRCVVGPHWFRGASYLKIGWHWLIYALVQGYELYTTLYLSSEAAPEPAMASKKQDAIRRQSRFVFEYEEAA